MQTVAMLEPVALDVTKVVDAAVKSSGGDEVLDAWSRRLDGVGVFARVAC